MKKNIVAGLGEIGSQILKLISKNSISIGYDIDPSLIDYKTFNKYEKLETEILHICIPFNNKFEQNLVSLHDKFNPELIVIHSTVSPYTTKRIQDLLSIPIDRKSTRLNSSHT